MNDHDRTTGASSQHDAYASEYDRQIKGYECFLAEALFGLSFEYVQSGESLLDLGTGSGLAGQLYAKAGLEVYGMDFSSAMLQICRIKAFAVELRQHDMNLAPYPYPDGAFDHLVSCGVLHFLSNIEVVFSEASRIQRAVGIFAFTTKAESGEEMIRRQAAGEMDVYTHRSEYVQRVISQHGYQQLKKMQAYVGLDPFHLWVVQKTRK